MGIKDGFDLGNEIGWITLALDHRQAADRQRDADHRVEVQATAGLELVEAVFLYQRLDGRPALGSDVGNDEILVRRDAKRPLVDASNGAQAIHHRAVRRVDDAAVLDEQRAMGAAVLASDPAERIAIRGKVKL